MTITVDKACGTDTAKAGSVSGDVPRVTQRIGEGPHYQDYIVAAQSVDQRHGYVEQPHTKLVTSVIPERFKSKICNRGTLSVRHCS